MSSNLIKNTISLSFIQIANYVIPFIVLIHLGKTLGIEKYGIVSYSSGIATLGLVIIGFGFDLSATSFISKNRHNKNLVAKYVGSVLTIKAMLSTIVCLVILIYAFFNKKYEEYFLLFILTIIPMIFQGFIPDWFFRGIEEMQEIAIYTIGTKILYLILVLLTIKSSEDYLWIPINNGISQMSALILSYYSYKKFNHHISLPNIKYIKYTYKSSLHFFYSRLAVVSYMNSGTVILGIMSTPAIIGTYSMAEQLYKAMQSLFIPISSAIYPYMVKKKNINLYKKVFFLTIIIALLTSSIGYFIAPYFVEKIMGVKWLEIIPILNIFFITLFIHVGALMSGYSLAAIIGNKKIPNKSVIIGSIFYFMLLSSLYLLENINEKNIVIVMTVVELYIFIYRFTTLYPQAIAQKTKVRNDGDPHPNRKRTSLD